MMMYLALTDEQVFLREAAADALSRRSTVADARAALEGESVESLWPVAVEAGWTGLLSGEDADGAALGAYEALLVLEACGRVLADARLLGHLPAVALLEAAGRDLDLRASLAAGERRAALVDGDLSVSADGAFSGEVSFVLDAPGADVLVLAAGDAAGVIDANAPGVAVTPVAAYDATRSLATVRLSGARASLLELSDARLGRDLQRALLAAESVGAADGCLAMARDYAVDRVAFGRPIGSYQAIKHKLVETLRRIEGARSLLVAAGRAWDAARRASHWPRTRPA